MQLMHAPDDVQGPTRLAYRVDEAARSLGLSEHTLYRKIPARKWGGRIMVLRADLEAALQGLKLGELTRIPSYALNVAAEHGLPAPGTYPRPKNPRGKALRQVSLDMLARLA